MNQSLQWFETWFDSPYYPLLYQNRDQKEAKNFLEKIIRHTGISSGKKILDLACGSGRYSNALASKGFRATGYDLSPNRIAEAAAQSTPGTTFKIHDMRRPFPDRDFDMVLNLFTSFGYFEDDRENHFTIKNIYNSLKVRSWFVLDYLNVPYINANLRETDEKTVGNVDFQIRRYIAKGKIFKSIEIIEGEKRFLFTEKIRAFEEKELTLLLRNCGFFISDKWGDYSGNPYHPMHSPRLIYFARKIHNS